MTSLFVRAAESVHWYGQDGSPQYTVKSKTGSDRPTTLRDARKLNLVPSVTTILKTAAKPGLEAWKLEQMMLACLTLPRMENEDEKHFISRLQADSKESAKAAAERGTRIHESVERWYTGDKNVEHVQIAQSVEKALDDHFGLKLEWITEKSFSCFSGYGGKVDLHADSGDLAGDGVVADVKTKEFGPDDDLVAYDEHLMQLAAYRVGLDIPLARCLNIFVSSTHPGLVRILEWSQEDLSRGFRMFDHLLCYWKLKNNFGDTDLC
jgi:hypothetical protein